MSSLKRLFELVPKYWKRGLLALFSLLIGTGLSITVPFLVKKIIDGPLVSGDLSVINKYVAIIMGVAVARGITGLVQTYCTESLAQSVVFDLRNRLYEHLLHLSFRYYDGMQTGELMSRITADVETLRMVLGWGMVNFAANLLMLVAVLIMLFSLNWELALVVLGVIPFAYFTAHKFSKLARPAYRALQAQVARLSTFLQENIAGIRVVKAFGQENTEISRFRIQNQENFEKNIASSRIFAFYFPLINLLSGLGVAAVLGVGGTKVAIGGMSLGTLVAFNTYLGMLLAPIRMFGWVMNMLHRAGASCERIFEVLDTQREIKDSEGAVSLLNCHGNIEFKDICFRYSATGDWVLQDISFRVKSGEMLGIIGATGSGKTSLVNLIPRFYEPEQGCIKIDGVDIQGLKVNSLRQIIGLAPQDSFLFSASIRENIAFGDPDMPFEHVQEAARKAAIADFIESLPDRYDTQIGERGIGLSGGQKQRLALARALALKPSILILDDTTSSVDAETEEEVSRTLTALKGKATVLVIAHRFSLLQEADHILVLERGKLVQQGSPQQLASQDGIYREMLRLQAEQGVSQ